MKSRLTLWLAIILVPATCLAQTTAPASTEHVTAGGSVALVIGATPWTILSANVSVPVASKLGIDVSAGGVGGTSRLDEGQIPTGATVAVHLRWMPRGRGAGGSSFYLLGGPRYLQAKDIGPHGEVDLHAPIRAVELGIGWDWLLAGGARVGIQLANAAGEGPLPSIAVILQWRMRR